MIYFNCLPVFALYFNKMDFYATIFILFFWGRKMGSSELENLYNEDNLKNELDQLKSELDQLKYGIDISTEKSKNLKSLYKASKALYKNVEEIIQSESDRLQDEDKQNISTILTNSTQTLNAINSGTPFDLDKVKAIQEAGANLDNRDLPLLKSIGRCAQTIVNVLLYIIFLVILVAISASSIGAGLFISAPLFFAVDPQFSPQPATTHTTLFARAANKMNKTNSQDKQGAVDNQGEGSDPDSLLGSSSNPPGS